MLNSKGRYVLGVEAVTPAGMNVEISTAVASANVAKFSQQEIAGGLDRYPYAHIEYINGSSPLQRHCEMLSIVLDSLLAQLPRMLKPVPLLLSIPSYLDSSQVQAWLDDSDYGPLILVSEIVTMPGPQLVGKMTEMLDGYDAIMCVATDSLYEIRDDLVHLSKVMSSDNPWGVIPSEGAAGVTLCRSSTVDTLKLSPLAKLGYLDIESQAASARAMYGLVQKASKQIESFGEVYTDMTNLRNHTEDYGFALGAKAERFTNPQQPKRINDLWGTLGSCSSLALISYATKTHSFNNPISLLMFDVDDAVGLLQLQSATL